MNQQWRAEPGGVGSGGALVIFRGRLCHGLAQVIRRGEKLFVILSPNPNPFLEVTDRDASVTGNVSFRMSKDRHQRDQAAVTPAHDRNTSGVDIAVPLEHDLAGGVDVFDFEAAVIDEFKKISAITGAAAVIG